MNLMPFVFLFLIYALPTGLTVINLINLVHTIPRYEKVADVLTFTLGPLLTCLLWLVWDMPNWEQPVILGSVSVAQFHAFLDSRHLQTILVLALCALVAYSVLRFNTVKKLPPLPTVLCIGGIEIGLVLSLALMVQLSAGLLRSSLLLWDGFYMTLFPLNYILCSLRLLRVVTAAQVFELLQSPPKRTLPAFCYQLLSRSLGWVLAAFLLALPLLALLLGVLVLLGQAPDAVVRAFTDTSDWVFSQRVSPPPVEYHGHYLCTVAAGGHPHVVKPTRYGVRCGEIIVVNRQLCVANAFEDLIYERIPTFHRIVRQFYDRHGYPLSKLITSPTRADVTYLLMKPLEWCFLLVLYTFDVQPEKRIARQYLGS